MRSISRGSSILSTRYLQAGHPTDEEIHEAELANRWSFHEVLTRRSLRRYRIACYEIAHSLLDGKDPELELENLGIVSQGFGSVRTTYNRSQIPIEHIINGIPSVQAWRHLEAVPT